MKIGVIYNKYISDELSLTKKINEVFREHCSDYKILSSEEMELCFDFVFAIGGDGTILNVAKFYAQSKTPVMGVNLGRLGFLSQSELAQLSSIVNCVINRKFMTEERRMLKCNENEALNDFVIKGSEKSRTTKLILEINNEIVSEYVADGLIISTPTGSTAYCLSAGGPIITPNVEANVIVPICPHTLTARPLVIPNSEIITVSSKECELTISADGYELNKKSNSFSIQKSDKNAILAFLPNNDFYKVLSEKLFWGISPCKKV